MEPTTKFMKAYEMMIEACEEGGFGDPFSFSRGKEIYLAIKLRHTVHVEYSGPDAFDDEGACEYKSTTQEKITASYTGISCQETWERQVNYLRKEKIGRYRNHYCARFKGSEICEVWWLGGVDVCRIAEKKLKKTFYRRRKSKDPRLSFSLSKKEIMENGIRII